ncbi:MAG TPA: GNAT family N-acetyltransferase [Methylomirabilota bacterium]|nr:GNAT family N-acetyltransferase [Methylomirabilota bacterium]
MAIALRPATAADEAFLWEMLYLASHLGDEGIPASATRAHPGVARYLNGWGRPHDLGVVAADAGRPVGAAWARLLSGDEQGYGHVDDRTPELAIAVVPTHRRLGVGRALLAALIDAARGTYPALSLSVRADSDAVRLYRRLGFQPVPGTEHTDGRGGVSTMRLSLAQVSRGGGKRSAYPSADVDPPVGNR